VSSPDHTPKTDDAPSPQDAAPDTATTKRPGLVPADVLTAEQDRQSRPDIDRHDPIERARLHRAPGRAERKQRSDLGRKQRRKTARKESVIVGLDKAAIVCAILAVVAAPLAIGGVHIQTIGLIASVASLSAVLTLVSAWWSGGRIRLGLPGVALLGLAAFSFAQSLPLPTVLVETLSPTLMEWFRYAWGSTHGQMPRALPLALNVAESVRGGFALLACFGVYLTAANVDDTDDRLGQLLTVIPVVGILLVAIGLAQRALGSDARLFFYHPSQVDGVPFFAASFVNPNHLAAFLGMAGFVPLALPMNGEARFNRSVHILLFLACSAGMFMTLSGNAIVAWIIALSSLGIMTWRRQLRGQFTPMFLRVGLVAVVGVALFAAWAAFGGSLEFLARQQGVAWVLPTTLWDQANTTIAAFPIAGVGRGGFGDAVATLGGDALTQRYTYVNNGFLQLLVDHGVVAGSLYAAAMVTFVLSIGLRPRYKTCHLPIVTGLFATFVFVGFESLGSFSLEIPGVAVPGALLLGIATRVTRYEPLLPQLLRHLKRRLRPDATIVTPRQRASSATMRRIAITASTALLFVLATATAPTALQWASGQPEEELRAIARTPAPLPEEVDRTIQAALACRPASSNVHLAAAVAQKAAGDDLAAAAALERAIFFRPSNPSPHLLRARILLTAGQPDDAVRSFARAIELAARTGGTGQLAIALEIARKVDDPTRAVSILPDDPALWDQLLTGLIDAHQSARARDIATALLARFPSVDRAAIPLAALARIAADQGQWADARDLAQRLLELEPPPPVTFEVLARDAIAQDQPRHALELADKGIEAYPRDVELRFIAASVLVIDRQTLGYDSNDSAWNTRISEHLRALRPRCLKSRHLRHRFYKLSAQYLYDTGRTQSAARDLRAAMDAQPDDPETRLLLARVLEEDREDDQALALYTDFVARFPDHPDVDIARSRAEALKGRLDPAP